MQRSPATNGETRRRPATPTSVSAGAPRQAGASVEVRLSGAGRRRDGRLRREVPKGTAVELETLTADGELRWSGACGQGCRLDAQTLPGNLRLALAPRSGFELSFSTRSGEVHDRFGLTARTTKRGRRHGLEAKAAEGEGRIECDTFSGDLELARTGK